MHTNGRNRILLVEDDPLIATSGKISLQQLGYDVVTASTGETAVELCKNDSAIDLILMDIELGPGIDGTNAAQIILLDRDIPVVFLSSHTEPDIVEKTQKITSYGYVVKGSSTTVLDASIKMAFKLFETKSELAASERKYHALFAHNRDACALHEMIYDDEGKPVDYRYIAVNHAFERITGLKAEEVVNKRVLEILPNTEPYWIETFGQVARTGTSVVVEDYTRSIDKYVEVTAFQPEENQFACVFTDITERKQTEKTLCESVYRFNELVAKVPVGVYVFWIRADGRMEFEYLSDRWCAIHKLRREDVLADIATVNNQIHPHERESFLERNRQAARDRKPFLWEGRFEVSVGELRLLKIESTPVELDNGDIRWFGVTQDITEQKEAERELFDQNQFLQTILETSADGFWVVNPDRMLVLVNESYCRMSGYTREELASMHINQIDAIEHPKETAERIQRIMANGYETFETQHRRKDGTSFHVEVSASRLDRVQGVCVVCFCRDITERKRAEEEIKMQLAQQTTLLTEAHHRIKNNIASIESFLAMQADSTSSPEVAAALTQAVSRVHSIRALYETLLIGKSHSEIPIKTYIEDLVESLVRVNSQAKEVTIGRKIADFTMKAERAVPVGIVINELLTNVFKYAFVGRTEGHVAIELERNEERAILTVQDDGIGFSDRGTANTSPGFGLIIVSMLAEQLGGSYTVESSNGTRSVVEFEV